MEKDKQGELWTLIKTVFRCLLVPAGYSAETRAEMQDVRKDANANPNMTLCRVL